MEKQLNNTENEVNKLIDKFAGLTEIYWFYNHTSQLVYDVDNHEYLLVTPSGLEPLPSVTHICHSLDKSKVLLPWCAKMMEQKAQVLMEPFVKDGAISISKEIFDEILKLSKTAHKEKLDDSGNIGKIAHSWIEDYSKALITKNNEAVQLIINNTPEDIRAKSACIAFLDWSIKHNFRPLVSERKIYSRRFRYAGTMDGTCLIDSCDNPSCCKEQFKDRKAVQDYKTSNYLYNEFVLQVASYKQAYQEETGELIDSCILIRLGKEDATFEVWQLGPETFEEDWNAFKCLLDTYRAMEVVEHRMLNERAAHQVWKKKKKEEEKAELYKIACKGSGTYKGTRKPRCNNGNPCQSCLKKYQEVQAKELAEIVKKDLTTEEK